MLTTFFIVLAVAVLGLFVPPFVVGFVQGITKSRRPKLKIFDEE